MTLYELTSEFLQLQALLEDPDIDADVITDSMEAINMDLEDKADGYAKVIRNMEGSLAAIKTEQERLANKKNLLEAGIKRLKDNLQESMIATGKKKFKTNLFSFNVQKNGGADPVIVDVETSELPDDLVIITEAPDKKAIAALLKSDPETGAKYAHFADRGESLRIK